jgi:DNA-binding PadR family transcriptional regulator
MADRLNATQGSLLGFLYDTPRSGWELLREVQGGLAHFWNVTPSHVYRELRTLEERRFVKAGKTGIRERRPFRITAAGQKAFKMWIAQEPGPEQIRFPLLVTLWFGHHLDSDCLSAFLDSSRLEHEERLRTYEAINTPDPHTAAVVAFGITYEKAIIGWLENLERAPVASNSVGEVV